MEELNLLKSQAIKAALSSSWQEAVEINSRILTIDLTDVEAMNRLARAWGELGKMQKAREMYGKVLKLDKFNTIAQKGLTRLKTVKTEVKMGEWAAVAKQEVPSGEKFLEEVGRTKVVQLLHPADSKTLASLSSGDEVQMVTGKHRVCISDMRGKYLGRLPDDLAFRLIKLIGAGNKYEVLVKSVEERDIKIFLREIKRAPKVAHIPSFPAGEKINYVAFTPPDLVYKEKPDVRSLEEEEEGEEGEN